MKDIILRRGGITVHVNAFGAELKGLERDGIEYLYDGDPAYYPRTSPTLFPIVGRFLSDTYFAFGRPYRLEPSGFAKDRNFETLLNTDTEAVFRLVSDARTLESYPWPFSLVVRYALTDSGVSVSYDVENTGGRPMPFAVGCHTAYRWPLIKGETPDNYRLEFEKDEDLTSFNPFNWKESGFVRGRTRPLSHSLFENFTRSVTGIRSDSIVFHSPDNAHGVTVDRREMPYLAVWTLPDAGAEFLCIEPCTGVHAGAATVMEDRLGSITVEPGAVVRRSFGIDVW